MIEYLDELEEKMVKAVKLFLRIPMVHRKFVLDKSLIGVTASILDNKDQRHKEWANLVYKPLLRLTRTSKTDLTERKKAKLLDKLLEQTGIDVFTFKRLLEEDKGNVLLLVNTYVEPISEEDKIREWLKEVQGK